MIFVVLIIAAILRFYQLGSLPPALDWDEVSNAYNGYSILKTGSDEFGQSFPILFRAYDGYVPPVLIWLNSISTGIFGLNELAARIPNALLGILTVYGVYLLVKKLGNNQLGLIAALFLAISPWHIMYSRVNTFALTPVFFIVWGLYFFWASLEKRRFLVVSTIFFMLAIFSYFAAYIFVPMFVLALVVTYRKKLEFKNIILAFVPIFLSAFLILFVLPGGQNRLRGISIFSDPDTLKIAAQEAEDEGFAGRVFHNRRFVYAQEILNGYLVNFRGDFLFGKGDAAERMVVGASGSGLLSIWFLPFLLVGVLHLFDKKPQGWNIWLLWLLIAPIAAATSLPQPVSTRTTLMIIPLVVITAYGFDSFVKSRRILARIAIIFLVANFFLFTHQYFEHFAIEKSDQWFYGYRQLFDFLNTDANQNRRTHFFFKQHENLDQIHMFTLFYNKVDPATWQANGGTKLGCGGTTGQFAFNRYDFIPISCLKKPVDWESYNDSDLIVTSSPIDGSYLEKIEYLDGKDAFYVYQYRNVSSIILDLFTLSGTEGIENPDSRFPLSRE